jgi:two-component system, sensor histidine kinase
MSLPEFLFDRLRADIRQQMDGVLALSGQLNRHRLSPDAEACVHSVADAALTVRRLLDAVLDLRSPSGSDIAYFPQPLRLRETMDEVQERWQRKAQALGMTLLVSYDGDPEAAAMADPQRLMQLFDGFIGEAMAAQSRGAVEASLSVETTTDAVRIVGRVRGSRDAGWDRYDDEARFQAVDARLGLEVAFDVLLARRILSDLLGSRRVESNAGASDTVLFEIELPPVVAAATQTPSAASPSRAVHVLVVDDNATNRMVAQSLVEMFDCTSEAAEDGDEALEFVQNGRFDLILMDIKMPRMDGVAATRAIRALPGPVGMTPIIALTANADPEDAAGYLAAGMNGVVEKPMKPEQLLAALQQALSGSPQAAAA